MESSFGRGEGGELERGEASRDSRGPALLHERRDLLEHVDAHCLEQCDTGDGREGDVLVGVCEEADENGPSPTRRDSRQRQRRGHSEAGGIALRVPSDDLARLSVVGARQRLEQVLDDARRALDVEASLESLEADTDHRDRRGADPVEQGDEARTRLEPAVAEAGCVAFSQANVPITDTQVLWRAMQYAGTFGFPVWLRAEDRWIAADGVAHDGEVATRLGLAGIPAFAETIALGTALQLVRATGTRVHFCRLSSAAGVEMIRAAKKEGLPVSCDVAIHHVHLCELDLGYYDSQCRLEPPLRSQRDRDALAAGLADGTVDCVVSDHTPVDENQKQLPFAEAEPGATGLELLLPLALKWGAARKLPLAKTLARVTSDPARILGVQSGRIEPGAPADLVLFDPEQAWRVVPAALRSQGKNTPFLGYELAGRVRKTIVAGSVVFEQA